MDATPQSELMQVPVIASPDDEPQRDLGQCRRFGCHKPAAEGSKGYCTGCAVTVYRLNPGSRHRVRASEPLPKREKWEYEPIDEQHPEFVFIGHDDAGELK